MLPIRIAKLEQDMGPCVTVMCPHCQKESRFSLRRLSAGLVVLGNPLINFDSSYQLICGSCSFRKDLDDAELSSAHAAQDLFRQLEANEIDPARYSEALEALVFPTLHTLRAEAATWSCPVCKEAVPATFNACWNCNSPRPGLQKPNSTEDCKQTGSHLNI